LTGVDANQLLSSVSNLKQVLYGLLAANADTRFTASTSTDAAKTLDGKVNLNLQNGKLVGIDLLNQLARIGQFVQGQKASEPFTNIARLTGDFNINKGVAQTNNLQAMIDGGNVAANGLVNLANQTLDMRLTAVLSKEYTQTVGGTTVGGYLTTALANSKGELVMPVLVTGSLTNPIVTPDYKTITQMKLENILPGSSGGGLLQSVIGGKQTAPASSGQQQPGTEGQQPAQQNTKPGSPLQGILDALGGKQKSKQQQPAQQQPKQQPSTEEEKLPDPSNPK
jgi:hypothetical protein